MALNEQWQDWLKKIKESFGIMSTEIDGKLERLLTATGGHPKAQELADLVRRYVSQESINVAILKAVLELKDLVATGKSVPKRNRSALA